MVVKGSNQTVIVALKARVPNTTTYDNGSVADKKIVLTAFTVITSFNGHYLVHCLWTISSTRFVYVLAV